MLRPGKHAHPDQTLVAVATVALRGLRQRRVMSYDDLRSLVEKKSGPRADVLFVPAVALLFLLDLLEYQAAADAFEYRGR
jgi:hypothetical protein